MSHAHKVVACTGPQLLVCDFAIEPYSLGLSSDEQTPPGGEGAEIGELPRMKTSDPKRRGKEGKCDKNVRLRESL